MTHKISRPLTASFKKEMNLGVALMRKVKLWNGVIRIKLLIRAKTATFDNSKMVPGDWSQ